MRRLEQIGPADRFERRTRCELGRRSDARWLRHARFDWLSGVSRRAGRAAPLGAVAAGGAGRGRGALFRLARRAVRCFWPGRRRDRWPGGAAGGAALAASGAGGSAGAWASPPPSCARNGWRRRCWISAMIAHLSGRIEAIDARATAACGWCWAICVPARSIRSPAGPASACAAAQVFVAGDWLSLTAQLDAAARTQRTGRQRFRPRRFFRRHRRGGLCLWRARSGAAGAATRHGRACVRPASRICAWRMTARIHAGLPGSEGAIASALITGERGGIDADDEAALRDAGLAHVLAIAGLHMALVGMGLFWLVRAVLAAFPVVALQLSDQEMGGRRGAGGRGFLSGHQRRGGFGDPRLCHAGDDAAGGAAGPSGAVDAQPGAGGDHPSAARPESITEPGFQMSFAAVAALIAVAEWEQQRERHCPARRVLSLSARHRRDQPGGQPGHHAVRDLSFRPRRPLRRAGQSAGHAGDGICGDAGGGAQRGGDAVRAGERAAASAGLGHRCDAGGGPLGLGPARRGDAGAGLSGVRPWR